MTPCDPVARLEELAVRIAARGRLDAPELWRFVAALVRVLDERPDWVAGLPEADRALFSEAMAAPLTAFRAPDHVVH